MCSFGYLNNSGKYWGLVLGNKCDNIICRNIPKDAGCYKCNQNHECPVIHEYSSFESIRIIMAKHQLCQCISDFKM